MPESNEVYEIRVAEADDGNRLDLFLSGELSVSRSAAQKLVTNGCVHCPDVRKMRHSTKVHTDQVYTVALPGEEIPGVIPEPVPFGVLYSDEHIVVVNKPAGIVVHPAHGHSGGTLANGLLYRFPEMKDVGDPARPGIVHRIDVGTSGLLVAARTQRAYDALIDMFMDRKVYKEYLALVTGRLTQMAGTIDVPIARDERNRLKMCARWDGRPAETDYRVLWTHGEYSLLRLRLHTGRTHQIRVHMQAIGCSLDGDTLYGRKDPKAYIMRDRVFLHAWRLGFLHPVTGERMRFYAPLAPELVAALKVPLSYARRTVAVE